MPPSGARHGTFFAAFSVTEPLAKSECQKARLHPAALLGSPPHFVAGLTLQNGRVTRITAPVIGYMVGSTEKLVVRYVSRHRWKYIVDQEIVVEEEP